jgi:hypothetical protein
VPPKPTINLLVNPSEVVLETQTESPGHRTEVLQGNVQNGCGNWNEPSSAPCLQPAVLPSPAVHSASLAQRSPTPPIVPALKHCLSVEPSGRPHVSMLEQATHALPPVPQLLTVSPLRQPASEQQPVGQVAAVQSAAADLKAQAPS